MAISLITVALNWLTGLLWGRKAPANPWGGNSLEWHTSSPPPHDNFLVPPVVDDPYNLSAWEYDASIDGWVPRKTAPRPPPPIAPAPWRIRILHLARREYTPGFDKAKTHDQRIDH